MAAPKDGILNINKPRGWTSHDVVARVRRLLIVQPHQQRGASGRGTARVGHAGTLDPLATGVLLICVGQATRIVEYLMGGEKSYRAAVKLGVVTDTYDIDGRVIATAPVPELEREDLTRALAVFAGEILQTPPPYSAIKQDGVPAYRKARRGETVHLSPRQVFIRRVELTEWHSPYLTIEIECDPGTYIRSLSNDLGQALGCGAVLTDLIRLRSGCFTLESSITLDELADAVQTDQVAQHLLPIEAALGALERVPVDGPSSVRLLNGQPIAGPIASEDRLGYAVEPDGSVRAILVYDSAAGLWRPKKVFPPFCKQGT
jgi:tRNA pseudouridine55 synthase